MIVFCFFATLGIFTFLIQAERERALKRSRGEWLIDSLGLFMQGIVVPLLQIFILVKILSKVAPAWEKQLILPAWIAFSLNFIAIDYVYYWNHRFLHLKKIWPIHSVHHGATHLDFIITSRNTLWTPFFIVYLWLNGFFIYVLKDPFWFVFGASVSAGLDLWRHTRFNPISKNALLSALNWIFIFPIDHAWHHSTSVYDVNFGANFKIWDRLHGTFHEANGQYPEVGAPLHISLFRQILWPFEIGKQ